MTTLRPFALLCLLALPTLPLMAACEETVVGQPDGGNLHSEDASVPRDNFCVVASDCAWGEIPREINGREDCLCVYGCPYLPQHKDTVARRRAQYQQHCDPRKDGDGKPCGVDDCASLGALVCTDELKCAAAP